MKSIVKALKKQKNENIINNEIEGERSASDRKKDRRRPWRVLIQPAMQVRWSAYFIFIALSAIVSINAVAFYFLIELTNLGSSTAPGTDVASILLLTMIQQKWPIVLGLGIFLLSIILFAFRMTHNVSGPAFALGRHVDALLQGDYGHKTHLRKDDELKGLKEKLNKLSEELKKKCESTTH